METSYSQLKQKDVVNIKDGKKLGRVCDVVFTFPEGKVLGIVAPNGWGFFRPGIFIDIRNIVKIGEDTVLVEIRPAPKNPPKRGHGYVDCCNVDDLPPPTRPTPRGYEEEE